MFTRFSTRPLCLLGWQIRCKSHLLTSVAYKSKLRKYYFSTYSLCRRSCVTARMLPTTMCRMMKWIHGCICLYRLKINIHRRVPLVSSRLKAKWMLIVRLYRYSYKRIVVNQVSVRNASLIHYCWAVYSSFITRTHYSLILALKVVNRMNHKSSWDKSWSLGTELFVSKVENGPVGRNIVIDTT